MATNYVIRSMNPYDNEEILQLLCKNGNIVIGDQVNLTMMRIDHNSIYVAEDIDTGAVVGVCSCFQLNMDCAIFGEYAVEPAYRQLGIGCALWNECIKHAGDRNCAILASPKNILKYKDKSGFKVIPARKVIHFTGYPQLFMLNRYASSCELEPIKSGDIADLVAYDEQICGFNRHKFLESSIDELGTFSILLRDIQSGMIVGFGIFRRNASTITPQPLYANSMELAEVLLYNALLSMTGYDKLSMEVWDVNHDAVKMAVDLLGLRRVKTSTIMFTDFDVGANFGKIFASSPSVFYPF